MCPGCLASAAWLIAGVMTAGGLPAMAAKLLPRKDGNKRARSQESNTKEK